MTPAERIAANEAKRAARVASYDEAREAQYADDLDALDSAEEEHGYGRVLRIDLNGWQPGSGATTMIVAKLPKSKDATYKKFVQQSLTQNAKASHKVDSAEAFAASCVVYPEPGSDAYTATVEAFAGVLGNVASQVVQAVQGKAAEEGK